jgi:uncharacterized membrane protein
VHKAYKDDLASLEKMLPLITVILLTLTPFLELRASIPYGLLATSIPSFIVVLVAVVTNVLLGWLLYSVIGFFVELFLRMKWFRRLWSKIIIKPRRKIERYVDRYGELGVALFIGIPLPGSGVYSAALGSYVLGVSKKKFFVATLIGVSIAAVLVWLIVLLGGGLFSWVLKT